MFFRRCVLSAGLVLLVLTFAGFEPPVPVVNPTDRIGEIDAVPRAHQWSLIPPVDRPVLKAVIKMKKVDRDALVVEGDARQRGIGLFIADQQGDVAALLAWEHLLDDKELTVPFALPLAQPEKYDSGDQTVSEYLNSIYHDWLGVNIDCSRKRFAKLIGEIDEPQHLVNPWIVRLRRVHGDEKRTESLKKEIEQLPEEVRWAVITIGWCNSLYSEEDARRLLADVSPELREQIRSGDSILIEEPLFRASSSYRDAVLEKCCRLMD